MSNLTNTNLQNSTTVHFYSNSEVQAIHNPATTRFAPPGGVARRKWNLLWRCKDAAKWRKLWNARYGSLPGDLTSMEYAMCLFMWLRNFTEPEIVDVMAAWYKRHRLQGNFYRLRHFVIPKTFNFARPYLAPLEQHYREKRRVEQARWRAKHRIENVLLQPKTRDLILPYLKTHGAVSPKQIAASLNLSAGTVSKQLSRMAKAGAAIRPSYGNYALGVTNEN